MSVELRSSRIQLDAMREAIQVRRVMLIASAVTVAVASFVAVPVVQAQTSLGKSGANLRGGGKHAHLRMLSQLIPAEYVKPQRVKHASKATGVALQPDAFKPGRPEIFESEPESEAEPEEQKCGKGAIVAESVSISEVGNCEINGEVEATNGSISISATGNITISEQVLAYYGSVTLTAGGSITLEGEVKNSEEWGPVAITAEGGALVAGNIESPANTVVLWSYGNMSLSEISTSSTSSYSEVRIFSNQGDSGSTPFTIGDEGNENGVGTIFCNNTLGRNYIYITNGGAGGIKYEGEEQLQVNATSGGEGNIFLDSRGSVGATGPVDLAGELSVSSTKYRSGSITIAAKTINVTESSILSTNQPNSIPESGYDHFITLSTEKLNLPAELKIEGTGSGALHPEHGGSGLTTAVTPYGSVEIVAPTNPYELMGTNTYTEPTSPLSVSGVGPLTVNTSGESVAAGFEGTPLTMSAGSTNITANGTGDQVYLNSGNTSRTTSGTLTFGGGPVQVEDTTEAKTGSLLPEIDIWAESIATPTSHVSLNASGSSGGSAGRIKLETKTGVVPVGRSGNNISSNVSAKTSGNAGTAEILAGSGVVNIEEGEGIVASSSGATSEGKGGLIAIVANEINNTTGTNATLAANGSGPGPGGSILLYAAKSLTASEATTAFKLEATAEHTYGGEVRIESGENVTLNGTGVKVAPTEGSGGVVSVYALNQVKVTSPIQANASVEGAGGLVELRGQTVTLPASGTVISANGAGQGKGGRVYLEVSEYDPLTMTGSFKINAKGGGSKTGGGTEGGKVIINHANGPDIETPIAVNKDISAVGSGPTIKPQGTIGLNSYECTRYSIGATWPTFFEDCANPASPTATDEYPVELAQTLTDLQSKFGKKGVVIWVFANAPAYNAYISGHGAHDQAASYDTGFTQRLSSSSIDSSAFEEVSPVYGSPFDQTEENLKETTGHQLGLALDIIESVQSKLAAYETYVADDFLYLDYTNVGSSAVASTPRNPCEGAGAPFAGLVDESTGEQFCGGTGEHYVTIPGGTTTIEKRYVSKGELLKNSEIIQMASETFAYASSEGWKELYAQSLAYAVYVDGLGSSQYLLPDPDNLMQQGYDQCSVEWLNTLATGKTVPPATAPAPYPSGEGFGACDSVPGWFRTELGH